jgi:hypothetical protein
MIAAALVLATGLVTGCAPAPPASSATTATSATDTTAIPPAGSPLSPDQALVEKDGAEVAVEGGLYVSADGVLLCSGWRESYPPQPAGALLPIQGLDTTDIAGLSSTGGAGGFADVSWSDYSFLISGTIKSGRLLTAPPPVVSVTYRPGEKDEVRLRFGYGPSQVRSGARVQWRLDITDRSVSPLTLTFASGLKFDVALLDRNTGAELYRWSTGRSFTQAIEETVVTPGASWGIGITEEALAVPPGAYRVVATVVASGLGLPAVESTLDVH